MPLSTSRSSAEIALQALQLENETQELRARLPGYEGSPATKPASKGAR
jgi:hypothetical protein